MKSKTIKFQVPTDCCMIANRHAVFLKYKKPFIKWEKKTNPWKDSDPAFNIDKAPGRISLFVKKENETEEEWLKKYFKFFFEEELLCWSTEKKDWPKKRTYQLFRRWFDISFTPYIFDEDVKTPIKII